MTAYSVIHNRHLHSGSVAPRSLEAGDAIAMMTDRQFHVCGDDVLRALPFVDPYAGGVFVTGTYAPKRVARLRHEHPTLPLIVEPRALTSHKATAEEPFRIDISPGELFQPSLDAALDLQVFAGGSDLAITPTGQIETGDTATVRAALEQANALDRTDTLFALVLEAGWLSEEHLVKFIRAVIDRSRHPVLLTFVSRTNPIESTKRIKAYRSIFRDTTGTVVAYRTDMSGFDARALGAITSAIGAYPSARRTNPIGRSGTSSDPTDLAPHELIADMLRFVRSKEMRRHWFAEAEPFVCFCPVCRGREIDRLHHTSADRTEGHLHNVAEIARLHAGTVGMNRAELAAYWRNLVVGALEAYEQLEDHIGVQLGRPKDLKVWAEGIA